MKADVCEISKFFQPIYLRLELQQIVENLEKIVNIDVWKYPLPKFRAVQYGRR